MRMKNVWLLVFCFILMLSLVACGENDMEVIDNNVVLEQNQTNIEIDKNNVVETEELGSEEELEELLNGQNNVGGEMRMVPIICNRK